MTIQLISVGVSLLKATADPRTQSDLKSKPALRQALLANRPDALFDEVGVDRDPEKASRWLTEALGPGGGDATDRLVEKIRKVSPQRWPASLSAELETFDRVQAPRLRDTDVGVLICSDTPPGLLAGLWNAIVLTGADLDRISYLPDPAQPLGALRGRVVIARVPGLNIGTEEGFIAAMRGLGQLAGHLITHAEVPEDEAVRCHLSGGYKAAIPYLIGMTEAIRSLPGGRDVAALVLHEETRSGPIRLPLRRIDPALVHYELAAFDIAGRCPARPKDAFLDGYAYQPVDDRQPHAQCQLTSFGEGLRALFGTAAPGLF